MIQWTTPTLVCNIPSDLTFDYLLITLKQGNTILEKRVDYSEVEEGVFTVEYSQTETSMFQLNKKIEAQLNIMVGETRMATNIVDILITKNLHDEAI